MLSAIILADQNEPAASAVFSRVSRWKESHPENFLVLVACAAFSFASAIAQDKPVPVEQEPYHHVQLKNDDIVVIRATLAPGERTAYHIHSCDRTGVEISNNTTTGSASGKRKTAPKASVPGDVFSDS